MCRSGAPCGCGAGPGLPWALWAALLAAAGVVPVVLAVVHAVAVAALVAVCAVDVVAAVGVVRLVRRGRPARPVAARRAVVAARVRAVGARAPLALEAPQRRAVSRTPVTRAAKASRQASAGTGDPSGRW